MIVYSYPIPSAIVFQQSKLAPSMSLCTNDTQLTEEIPAQELNSGNIRNLAKWVRTSAKVSVGTTEEEMATAKDYFHFGKIRAGDLMEAYGLLYRMRWVKYRHGRPTYELTLAKDSIDGVYAPQDEFQRLRFESTKAFIHSFDQMDSSDKEKTLAGRPLIYSELPQKMKDSLKRAVGALIEGNATNSHRNTKPDIDSLSEAKITIKDSTAPSTSIREIWLDVASNIGGFSFRWNDYDKTKDNFSYSRPVASIQEPSSNDTFSAEKMIVRSKKLKSLITIKMEDRTLASLLEYIATNFSVNFITNEDVQNRPLSFSCENIPLSEAMDRISKKYGDWEWELSPGDFIVMRSKESPRRRSPVKGDNP